MELKFTQKMGYAKCPACKGKAFVPNANCTNYEPCTKCKGMGKIIIMVQSTNY